MLKNDLKNDIEKTLQAHCPEPPEGFAERMDNKAISLMQKKHNQNVNKGRSRYRLPVLVAAAVLVLCFVTAASRDLIIRPDSIRARETTTPLVTALSEGHGEVTEGEGLSQEAIEALEVNFPGVADKLKPVNLSCEKQGIRMNVISALVEEKESWVVYSLQDLEGDRITRFATTYDDLSGNGDDTGYYCYLDHNQEEHKVTCVHYEEYGEPYQPVDNHFAFKVEDIGKKQITKIDLLPFLEKYGKTSDGVKMPDEAFVFGNKGQIYSTANMKVLDDSDQLNVSLYKDIYLTGIGWIDGKLHVRIQDRQQEKITIGSMSVYPVFLSAAGYFSETGKQCEMDQVEWSSAGDERKDLKEYIFDVRPDEVDKMELAAWADDTVDVTRDVWEVQIPADSILAENSTETAAPAAEAFTDNPVLLTEEAILREVMDAHVEDISYDDLHPIGLSTEKQGIRMDVVSGCRKGNNVYFLLTTQDLNAKYNDYECHPTFVYEHEDDGWDGYEARLNINRDEGKTTWLYRMDLSKVLPTENSTLRAGIKKLSFSERKEIDLLPMLKEYGRTEEGVTPPKESLRSTLDGKPIENKLKALDYQESLDIHLDGNVFLSAIGWIDNQLHVQFQNKSWALMQQEYPDIPYDNYMMAVNCNVKDKAYEEIHVDSIPMSWRETYEGPSWEESVFNCTPEDLDRMELYTNETISKGVLDDDWTVGIPMEMIQGETSEETAVQEEKPAEPGTLSNKEEVYLAYAYPGLREELKPVNMSCEKQGIRAEVIYALIKDQKLYVVYSLQDLEGDRIKDNLNTYYLDNLGGTGLYSMRLDWDETEEHKATFLKVYDIPEPVQPDGKLVVNLIGLMTEEVTTIDLLPLLKKYGKTVEGVDKPEDTLAETLDWSTGSFVNVDLSKYPTILDYTQPLDETLCGPVSLTGIGWIDNKLHVQIHNPDETTCTIGNTTYLSWMGTPRLAITEEKDSRNPTYDELSWGVFSNGETAWKKYAEYVWEIAPDDINHLELKADIYHHKKISDTTWKIEIPIAFILAKTDENTAIPEIEQTATAEPLVIEEEVNRQIEEKWPGITKELKQVNLSCEKQGIRFEVTSALVKGNEAWAVYTLEDATGNYGSPEEGYCIGGYEKDTEGKEPKTETYLLQRAGKTGRRQIYVKHIEAKNPLRTEDDVFTVGIKQVCIEQYKQIDLIPFLKEYGKNEEGIELPELHPAFSKTAREGMKILDYTQPLDISLLENVKLTGIGWIDNQLHTQIHFTADPIRTSDGTGHAGAGVNVYNSVTNDVVWPLGWNDNGDEFPDWMESVMDVQPDDLGQLTLTAEVWENKEILEDTWEVRIPLEEVLAEGEVTTE